MRNLSAALALALAPLFAHATEPSGLTITVQDLARRDGSWPYAGPRADSGPYEPLRARPEFDPRDPRNEGAVWSYGRNINVSPKTRITISFKLPEGRTAAVYAGLTAEESGSSGICSDFVVSTDRVTVTLDNTTDAPAIAEYHWRYIDVHQLTP